MRHRCATKNLSRTPAHRKALLRNLTINVLEHGRIRTTIQKAKSARRLVERIISLGKKGSLHARRLALSELGSTLIAKQTVRRVFEEIAKKYEERPGGYTRIIRLPAMIRLSSTDAPKVGRKRRSKFYGTRQGDNADMVLFELVEPGPVKKEKKRRKQLRRTTKKMRGETEPAKAPAPEKKPEDAAEQKPAAAPASADAKPAAPEAKPAAEAKPAGENKGETRT